MILLVAALTAAGCASPSLPSGQRSDPSTSDATASRTLVMAINTEVGNLSPKAEAPTNPDRTTRLFNAELSILDPQGNARPYLAEVLPQLNTASWQVFPDGRMETTWMLREGLTWQDGAPLTAEDFVFAHQVYRAPELAGFFKPRPQNIIEQVVAVDQRTVRLSWRSPYFHQGEELSPLPRHVLSEAFAAFEQDPVGQRDAFQSLRFWTVEYVGAGPYRLTGWEPASHLEGTAFDGHALGKPKIDRIELRFINNNNTVLANVMAGEVHVALALALRFEHAMTLRDQAGYNDRERKGRLIFSPQSVNTIAFQHRPEFQKSPGLLDARVRKAIAHATDVESINERLYEGHSPSPTSFVKPTATYYADVERAVTKYPYDPRRTEQLMAEAGYTKGRDGLFVDPRGQRFQPDFWSNADGQHRIIAAIVADNWQRAGIDAQPYLMSQAFILELEAISTYPGSIQETSGAEGIDRLDGTRISSPANRWRASNRSGWSNPDFDLQLERFTSALDVAERNRAMVEMMKIHSEHLPNFPLNFNLQVIAHTALLQGPQQEVRSWNVHEWEWQ
jgi:peptide/nickel transport system substrate-binding protein